MNQRPPGYEPDELPTALPRDICKRYISTDRPPRQGLTQKTFRPDLPGPAPNCLHTADREGKRLCGALLFRDSGVCLQRTERAGRMPCREPAFPGPTGGPAILPRAFSTFHSFISHNLSERRYLHSTLDMVKYQRQKMWENDFLHSQHKPRKIYNRR